MTTAPGREIVECLYIDGAGLGLKSPDATTWAFGLPDVEMRPFRCTDARGLWDQLQSALQRLDARRGGRAIMAVGEGCAAALALASQLPVARIVLIDPAVPVRGRWRRDHRPFPGKDSKAEGVLRTVRRLAGFARRNLPLCVSDLLIVEHGRGAGRRGGIGAYGEPVNCRAACLLLDGESAKDLYTIREFAVKEAISRFLHTGEVPKPLAENSEMCIIYG